MAHYFTKDTDESIRQFLKTEDPNEKNSIFEKGIRPAFEKLISSLIYTYGFYNIEDAETLKREALTNLYDMLPKFDPNRTTKGFSYFNVVAKNWFIHKTREKKKKAKSESELYYDLDHEVVRRDPNVTAAAFESEVEDREFWVSLYANMDLWRERLTKQAERKVLDAIVFILQNPSMVSIYSKKAVYLYLRELSGLNTKQVVQILKKMKFLYSEWKDEFFTNGE